MVRKDVRVPKNVILPANTEKEKRIYAIAFAEAGFTVLSVPPNQKAPPNEDAWQKLPPSDPKVIRERWTAPDGKSTDRNIAVTTGRSWIVMDFDKNKGGCESYRRLTVLLDKLPPTFTVFTQGGGFHLYYLCDEQLASGINVLDHIDLPGVDLRATPGYVLTPGSSIDGRRYTVLHDLPMATIPRWLLNELKDRKPGAKAKNREIPLVDLDTEQNMAAVVAYLENDAPEAIERAGGDTQTYSVACWVRDLGVSEPMALDLMLGHWNYTKALPPWDPKDLEKKVYNAFNHAQNRHGSKAAVLAENEFSPLPQKDQDRIAQQKPPVLHNSRSGQKPPTSSTDSRESPQILLERRSEVTSPKFEWLVDKLIPQDTVCAVYGAPGTFKSFFALHLADTIAAGRPFLGHKTTTPEARGDVVYLAAEGGAGLRKRLDAAEQVHGVAPDNVVFLRKVLNLRSSKDDANNLLKAIKEGGFHPCLLIVDTLAQSFGGGNENTSEDMGAFYIIMQHLRENTGASVVVIHHSGKDTDRGLRGHSNLSGNIETEIHLELVEAAPKDGEGIGFGTFKVKKQKDEAVGWSQGFAVQKVSWNSGETSSLAVRELTEGESAMLVKVENVKLSLAAHEALHTLHGQIGDGTGRSDVWRRGVVSRGVCTEDEWPAIRKELKNTGAIVPLGGKKVKIGVGFYTFGFETDESTDNPHYEAPQVVENKQCSKTQSTPVHTQSTPKSTPRIGVD